MIRPVVWLLLVTFVFATSSCKVNGNMMIEDIQNSLTVGMSRKQVESYFDDKGIQYSFTTREDDQAFEPKFSWKSEDAIGYYGALIRDVGTAWLILSSEHIEIRAEIDSKGKVSQVLVKKVYTGP